MVCDPERIAAPMTVGSHRFPDRPHQQRRAGTRNGIATYNRLIGKSSTVRRLMPQPIDNAYRGTKPGLWLLAMVVFVKLLQSASVIFDGYSILQSADGVPVETFPAPAAQSVVALF